MSIPVGRTKKATRTAILQVGDESPDFSLPTHLGQRVGASSDSKFSLSSLRGKKWVVLAFFPLAYTPV